MIDHLSDFVDIHNHLIPTIDDGAKSVDESLELISGFQEFGVNNFICTPHIMHNYYDNTPEKIEKSFEKLKQALTAEQSKDVQLRYAAEYLIDDNFENILEENQILPLSDTHILIEMSYLQPSINFGVAVEKIKKKGYFPVFAHPERYQYLAKDYHKYHLYKKKEIRFQLNMLSLSDYYGISIKKNALKLLEDGMYDFLGSDVHNMKQLFHLKNHVVVKTKTLNRLLPIINNTIQTFY
nr:CpsB/CapC family capsule biosynthesis tyrosine phosphatase [Allomuricauda sp.]